LVPDRNVEYLFYQALIGVWPPGLRPVDTEANQVARRTCRGLHDQSGREGNEVSSWTNPNTEYEVAVRRFIEGALDTSRPNQFLADFPRLHHVA